MSFGGPTLVFIVAENKNDFLEEDVYYCPRLAAEKGEVDDGLQFSMFLDRPCLSKPVGDLCRESVSGMSTLAV